MSEIHLRLDSEGATYSRIFPFTIITAVQLLLSCICPSFIALSGCRSSCRSPMNLPIHSEVLKPASPYSRLFWPLVFTIFGNGLDE